MTEIIGIRFKNSGRIYFFDPCNQKFQDGDMALVDNDGGVEIGEIAIANKNVPKEEIVKPLKRVIRKATYDDRKQAQENVEKEQHAFAICEEKIIHHKLEMKLVDVEYAFDSSRIMFYFTAANRVDFRELVKDLASIFRTRIELRQIGVRDEAKMLGGYGVCGQEFCCSRFLKNFEPVSIRMAKDQGLSLNPSKISGNCGRLMCCLQYEHDTYMDLIRITPKVGASVITSDGKGTVTEVDVLSSTIKVKLENQPDSSPISLKLDDIKSDRQRRSRRQKPKDADTN